jgi:hypothetical protein
MIQILKLFLRTAGHNKAEFGNRFPARVPNCGHLAVFSQSAWRFTFEVSPVSFDTCGILSVTTLKGDKTKTTAKP